MTIYIDVNKGYKCHLYNDGTMLAYETDTFEGKCQAYIEGFRLVPEGYTWIREDGVAFAGLMISPWKDYDVLEAVQSAYEEAQSAYLGSAEAAYQEGVNSI